MTGAVRPSALTVPWGQVAAATALGIASLVLLTPKGADSALPSAPSASAPSARHSAGLCLDDQSEVTLVACSADPARPPAPRLQARLAASTPYTAARASTGDGWVVAAGSGAVVEVVVLVSPAGPQTWGWMSSPPSSWRWWGSCGLRSSSTSGRSRRSARGWPPARRSPWLLSSPAPRRARS